MPEKPYRLALVIPAAGYGRRLGAGMGKGLLPLAGRPLLYWSVVPFLTEESPSVLVVAAREEEHAPIQRLLTETIPPSVSWTIVPGGAERADSVRHALEWLAAWPEWQAVPRRLVAIHDAARPFLPVELWRRLVHTALAEGAAVPGLPVVETLKRVGPNGKVEATVDREGLWTVQTPQVFEFEELLEAYRQAAAMGLKPTDDAGVYELTGRPIRVIPGVRENIKITTPEDLALAEAIFHWRKKNV